jgi:hypothetical protein
MADSFRDRPRALDTGNRSVGGGKPPTVSVLGS